jgi:hypothetical protein
LKFKEGSVPTQKSIVDPKNPDRQIVVISSREIDPDSVQDHIVNDADLEAYYGVVSNINTFYGSAFVDAELRPETFEKTLDILRNFKVGDKPVAYDVDMESLYVTTTIEIGTTKCSRS